MKIYQKPQVKITEVCSCEVIANGGLGAWLEENTEVTEANITTFEIAS